LAHLAHGLRAIRSAHEGLHLTSATRAVVTAAHAAVAQLLWVSEMPSPAALAAQDALNLTPQYRLACQVVHRVRNDIHPRWRIALDAIDGGVRRASRVA
jgi:hypothetical protein